MNENDKNKFIILGFLLGAIGLFAFFVFSTKLIPIWIFCSLIVGVQTFFITPAICKLYYSVNDSEIGISRFIPFYQNICIFGQVSATIALIILVLMLLAGLGFLPLGFFQTLFGEYVALNMSTYALRVELLLLVAYNIVVGIGFFGVFRDVNLIHLRFMDTNKHSKFEVVYYILLFIPIIRGVSLSSLYNRLYSLEKLNQYSQYNSDEDEELFEDE